jgi:hypothetical protein
MPSEKTDPAARLLSILEHNREKLESEVPADLLSEIAAIQQQSQFDDARNSTRKEIRKLVEQYAKRMALKESRVR